MAEENDLPEFTGLPGLCDLAGPPVLPERPDTAVAAGSTGLTAASGAAGLTASAGSPVASDAPGAPDALASIENIDIFHSGSIQARFAGTPGSSGPDEATAITGPTCPGFFGPSGHGHGQGPDRAESRAHGSEEETRRAARMERALEAAVRDPRTLAVRLASRLHDMICMSRVSEQGRQALAQETLDYLAPMAGGLGLAAVKAGLEDLSLMTLRPEDFRDIRSSMIAEGAGDQGFVNRTRDFLVRRLSEFKIPSFVEGRAKHVYGVWRKMVLQNLPFPEIHDLYSFRVTVRDAASCYRTLGAVHTLFKSLPGRYHDYISVHAPDGYRSLHTVVMLPGEVRAEIRIGAPGMRGKWGDDVRGLAGAARPGRFPGGSARDLLSSAPRSNSAAWGADPGAVRLVPPPVNLPGNEIPRLRPEEQPGAALGDATAATPAVAPEDATGVASGALPGASQAFDPQEDLARELERELEAARARDGSGILNFLNGLRRAFLRRSPDDGPSARLSRLRKALDPEGPVLAFTPKNAVVKLPQGATPIDFAYGVDRDLGDRLSAAFVDGSEVGLGHVLGSLSTVHIVTCGTARPLDSWLGMAASPRTRSMILRALKAGNGRGDIRRPEK
jgi:hypothetical protein